MTWFAKGSQLESTEYQTGDLVKQQLRLFALEIAAREFRRKHRKNCECCPGHYLIVLITPQCHNSNLNRCLCSHCSHCSQCLLVSTSVY